MSSYEESMDLLDSTMAVLEADLSTLTPLTGKGILDEWIALVGAAENTTQLTNSLEVLKTQLESNSAPGRIDEVLLKLADQTQELSTMVGPEGDLVTRLEALASALRVLAGQLGNA